jgi:hypothetical protein
MPSMSGTIMTDDELRAMVRESIARHLGPAIAPSAPPQATPVPLWRAHPSFGALLIPSGRDEGGPCIIEPAVSCNHCGYCQSLGH